MDIDKILDEFPKKMKEKREAEKEERKREREKLEAQRDEIDRCFREIIRPVLAEVERKLKKKEKDYYCEIEGVPLTSTILFYPKVKPRQDYKGIAYKLIFKAERDYIIGTRHIGDTFVDQKKFGIKTTYKDEVKSFVEGFISEALKHYEKGSL